MWQDNNPYAASSSQNQYYSQPPPPQGQPLQFYAPSPVGNDGFYPGSRPSLDGNPVPQGSIQTTGGVSGGNIQIQGGWWTAFGTGGFEGEPPLLEELGINFSHIRAKSMTVLNPLSVIDERIMDDADLAGPLMFVGFFGLFLAMSGKPNFGYVYGVGLLGMFSMYILLNLMSQKGIDAYRVTSVLGYCLLPMVGAGVIGVALALDNILGYLLASVSIIWCTYAASGIFVVVLHMLDQRFLVAYPVALLYGCFALLLVFSGTK